MVTISGVGLFALLSAAFLVLLVRERRHRRRTEKWLAETLESISNDTPTLLALENEVLANRSREQQRISNELHNGVSQNLAGIAMLLKGLEHRSQAESPTHVEEITRIADLIRKTSVKAQDLVLGRERSPGSTGTNLATALQELAARTQLLFRIPCRFEGDLDPHLETLTRLQLLAIAEEAVTNAVRHAHADHITLRLESDGENLIVAVEDDGRGLTHQMQDLHARGQRVMAARAEKLAAHLAILPSPPHGTRVECRLPFPGAPEEP